MHGRVLVVDDEPSVRFFERLSLEEAGLAVGEASSGAEALALVHEAQERFAAIVLDFRMPGMTGLEVARTLREEGDRTPIVLYTAYADPEVAAAAVELGLELIDKADVERLVGHVGRLAAA
ncbi:MAG: todT [Solirubrobacterales bacterium]|nr:todT [Solirubrobacterales bacterium]